MNDIFHYLKFKNLSKNWEKCVFSLGKMEFWTHWEIFVYRRISAIRKRPEKLYRLLDILPKQTTCEMEAIQVEVYIQQWFHDEQGAKLM